jgi:uncharacterized OB-fold protein
MSQFNTPGMGKTRCPKCGRAFVNGNKLNRHKRTCDGGE